MIGMPASLYLFERRHCCCYLGVIATSWLGDAFPAVLTPAEWYNLINRYRWALLPHSAAVVPAVCCDLASRLGCWDESTIPDTFSHWKNSRCLQLHSRCSDGYQITSAACRKPCGALSRRAATARAAGSRASRGATAARAAGERRCTAARWTSRGAAAKDHPRGIFGGLSRTLEIHPNWNRCHVNNRR